MKLILVYDIGIKEPKDQKRLNRAKKIARKYLHHVQRSVFEGEITEGQLARLVTEIINVVDEERDSVIIYRFPDGVKWVREILAGRKDPTDRVI